MESWRRWLHLPWMAAWTFARAEGHPHSIAARVEALIDHHWLAPMPVLLATAAVHRSPVPMPSHHQGFQRMEHCPVRQRDPPEHNSAGEEQQQTHLAADQRHWALVRKRHLVVVVAAGVPQMRWVAVVVQRHLVAAVWPWMAQNLLAAYAVACFVGAAVLQKQLEA